MKQPENVIKDIQKNKYHKGQFIISAYVDQKKKEIFLVFDDYQLAVVPFKHFKPSGDGTKANFKKVSIIDDGFTLKLGKYEASSRYLAEEYKLQ